jgi:Xaa-Pro dipeptidase
MTTQRMNHLIDLLNQARIDAIALNPSPTLTYLTGLHLHLMERPMVLLIVPGKTPALVLPELEKIKLSMSSIPLQGFMYGDNPDSWANAFSKAIQALNLTNESVGVEPERLRVLELRFLEAAAPKAKFTSGADILSQLRITKDSEELANMRKAVQIAQQALLSTLPMIKTGVSEREIGAELTIQLIRHGSDPDMVFSPIIASGPNSANPHAFLSDRKLAPGDLLVIDWGAAYHGYISDLTRTYAIGSFDPEFDKIARIVAEANSASRSTGRPGIAAGQVDQAARGVIQKAGYGQYFTHRVGHGIGMEGHEPPYMFGENKLPLAKGMTFTIEPGIYLPGRGGVRIEDDVVVTHSGLEYLSDLDRSLIKLA